MGLHAVKDLMISDWTYETINAGVGDSMLQKLPKIKSPGFLRPRDTAQVMLM